MAGSYGRPMKDLKDLKDALGRIVGPGHVTASQDELAAYSHDATFFPGTADLVVRPGTTNEVAEVVKAIAPTGLAIVARGAGTGLSGGAVPTQGGVVVSLERLGRLEVDAPAMCVVAGAGVVTADLQKEAIRHGLMYPPDPGSLATCTIGGNVATNAGGPSCLKYGVTSDYVTGLVAVLADGRIVTLGGKTRKRSAGYRLAQMFIGSEGTLGIVTEVTLKLIPFTRHRLAVLAYFSSTEGAANAVAAMAAEGILPAACELIDESSLGFVRDLLPATVTSTTQALLLVEQDSNDEPSLELEMKAICKVLKGAGAEKVLVSGSANEREALWRARRAVGARLSERRGFRIPEDIAVPIPLIPEMVRRIKRICAKHEVGIAIFGHAGDGNLHPSLIFEDRSPETLSAVADAAVEIMQEAISLGGTVSAEHGLGGMKNNIAANEMGEDQVEIMSAIKGLFDPGGILNPGKVLPTSADPRAHLLAAISAWEEPAAPGPSEATE